MQTNIVEPTPLQRKLAKASKDPLSYISAKDKKYYQGCVVAVILVRYGPHLQGKIIASGKNPEEVAAQVKASRHRGSWSLCEIVPNQD